MAESGAPPSVPLVESPSPTSPNPSDVATARAAAFARGNAPIPRKFLIIGASVLVGVALGGALLEKVFSMTGLNPTAKATTQISPQGVRLVKTHFATLPGGAPLAHLLGTSALAPNRAPAISLVDQRGARLSLSGERGKVVVLSFFDSACDDACPIIGSELATADRLLGARAGRVAFMTVNTDPEATAFASAPAAITRTGLAGEANASFLMGTIGALNPVWKHYGITIDVARSGRIAHNDLVYFIDPQGRLRYLTTPPADEARNGTYHLSAAEQGRVAHALATYAASLLAVPSGHGAGRSHG